MKLEYNSTDIIGAMTLGGTAQANGIYDSTNTDSLITGTSKIQVGLFANYTAWTTANALGQTTDQDYDHDRMPNGAEYFMGARGNVFTPNPPVANGTVTWLKSTAFNGSYAVHTSADPVVWTDVTENTNQVAKTSDSVIWTQPTGPESRFVRLIVTPN